MKESAQRKSLDWEKNKVELPLALQKQRLELEKLRVQRERADDRLKKLLADRELMTVKSPIDGIVYYGKCVRGKFSDSTSLAESLRRNGVDPAEPGGDDRGSAAADVHPGDRARRTTASISGPG